MGAAQGAGRTAIRRGSRAKIPDLTPQPHTPKSDAHPKDTQQTQIAFAFPSVPVTIRDYYAARAAEGVLSGGMSARLFTEVREKRGLCYSVGVRHETFKDRGTMVGYAGTGADRAQQTLDVTVAELRRLKDGIDGRRDRPREGRAEVVAHHAGGIDLGPRRRDRDRLVSTSAACARSTRFRRAIDGLTPARRARLPGGASRSATSRS